MTQAMADIIKKEALELSEKTGKYPYFSKPYPCAMEECLMYFEKWGTPHKDQMTIEHEENQTLINLKPLKGSGKRKLFTIKIWVA